MKCPHCNENLSINQIKTLRGQANAAIMTDKRRADLENRAYRGGGWPKGKPRKPNPQS
jgi:hypothetical protein